MTLLLSIRVAISNSTYRDFQRFYSIFLREQLKLTLQEESIYTFIDFIEALIYYNVTTISIINDKIKILLK